MLGRSPEGAMYDLPVVGGVAAVGVGVAGVAVAVAVVRSLEGAVVAPAISGGWCLAGPPREPFFDMSIDEVHEIRNLTAGFYATLEVTKALIVKLLASGMPLYTGPMDLCNVGHLARIPYFMGKPGDECDKMHVKALHAACQTMTQEDKNDATAHTVHLLAGGAHTNDDNEPEPEARICIWIATHNWISNIKCGFRGKINDTLIPYKMVMVPIQLNNTELEINQSMMAQITGSSNAAALDDTSNFNTKFYLDGQMKVVFPHHQSLTYPVVKSLDEWDEVRSTKVDTLIKVLDWQLESDDHHIFPVDEDDTMTTADIAAKALTPPPSNQLAEGKEWCVGGEYSLVLL
ncbi:hypothetical protein BDR03DRAFT_1018314 [Suillus americanus]|nr:hypothetical protein BDR03DRAFT_1018314 [Suillus americanus]